MSYIGSLNKGSLITSDGANNTELSAGADTYVLTADAAQPLGIKWAASGGGGSLITTYVANGAWTIDPRAKTVRMILWGGGGGGGSGRCGATTTSGGGSGGGAGSYYDQTFNASSLTGSPYAVTIGTGGAGGASINATTTNGNPGLIGNSTSVGAKAIASGGSPGLGGTASIVSGGFANYSCNGLTLTITSTSPLGAVGSAGGQGSNGNPLAATNVSNGFGAGGSGGCGYTAGSPRPGGSNANIVDLDGNILVLGGLRGANTGATAGNGNSPVNQVISIGGTGGGGGGHDGVVTAGSGGNGGSPGGGGGGGAGNLNLNPSGTGGNGGAGKVIIIEYF